MSWLRGLPPILLGSLLAAASPGPLRAQAIDAPAVDAILQDALKAWKVPGVAVAIVSRGRVVYLKGFGVRELGGRQPVTADTIFPLASCTKAFTTTALAMLADEGKLRWDDPVRKHVGYFHLSDPAADALVTLRDLVSHRTGLSGHDLLWYRSPWSQEEIIRRAGRLPLSYPFRGGYHYQSIMVMAAGQAVRAASGSPWDEFVRTRIFQPLGMAGAGFTTTAALKTRDHASPHRQDEQGRVKVIPWYPMTVPDPAGSINAGVRDLSKWVLFHLGDGTYGGRRLVSAANLAETHSPQTVMRLDAAARAMQPCTVHMNYGMGWVIQDYRGHRLVSHGGSIDGFRAHITLAPDDQLGLVFLNNLEGTQMNLAVSNSILDLVLGLGARDWNGELSAAVKAEKAAKKAALKAWQDKRRRDTKPSAELATYAGTYENPAYGTARVTFRDGALAWSWRSFRGPVRHFQDDTFIAAHEFLGDPTMAFKVDGRGGVVGMRFLDIDFKKTAAAP